MNCFLSKGGIRKLSVLFFFASTHFSGMSTVTFVINEQSLKVMQHEIKHAHTSPHRPAPAPLGRSRTLWAAAGPLLSQHRAGPCQFWLNRFGANLPYMTGKQGVCGWGGGASRDSVVKWLVLLGQDPSTARPHQVPGYWGGSAESRTRRWVSGTPSSAPSALPSVSSQCCPQLGAEWVLWVQSKLTDIR